MATVSDADSDRAKELLYRGLKELRGSLLLSIVAVGFGLLFVAVVFDSSITLTQHDGVLAGMFGVFGISAIVVGVAFYVSLKTIQRR